jgi:hypothetical protein
MKPSRVSEVIEQLLGTRWPSFLWGPPGVGKSSIVRQAATKLGLQLLDIRAALLDPTDIRGIPFVHNSKAVWSAPSFLPGDPESKGILFLDELTSAPPLVQASLYQLTLDRRVGEYRLPDGWRIIAAGNRAEDRAISFRMPSALANRFIHLDFETDFQDWKAWALDNRVHADVVAFLSVRRELLLKMGEGEKGFPTPRSWEMASDALNLYPDPDKAADILLGIVGEGASIEFLAFCRDVQIRPIVEAVLADPRNAPIPTKLDAIFALLSHLVSRSQEPATVDVIVSILDRLTPEFAVMLLNDTIKVNPKVMAKKGVQAFLRQHAKKFSS